MELCLVDDLNQVFRVTSFYQLTSLRSSAPPSLHDTSCVHNPVEEEEEEEERGLFHLSN